MKFAGGGWMCGRFEGQTKARGLNYVVRWDDDPDEAARRLFKLDDYATVCDAADFSWCIIAKTQIDWALNTGARGRGGRRKRRKTD